MFDPRIAGEQIRARQCIPEAQQLCGEFESAQVFGRKMEIGIQ
jgi:hypothetical protein